MGTSGKGSTVPSCILPLVIFKGASQNALPIICDYWLEVIAHGYGQGSTLPNCLLSLVIFKDASQNALPIIPDYWLEVIAHGKAILNPETELLNYHIT